jgi:hypothetical protein
MVMVCKQLVNLLEQVLPGTHTFSTVKFGLAWEGRTGRVNTNDLPNMYRNMNIQDCLLLEIRAETAALFDDQNVTIMNDGFLISLFAR